MTSAALLPILPAAALAFGVARAVFGPATLGGLRGWSSPSVAVTRSRTPGRLARVMYRSHSGVRPLPNTKGSAPQ